MHEVVQHVHDPVVPEGELLGLAVGVLDDVDEFPDDRLALGLLERQLPEGRRRLTVPGATGDGHHGEIEVTVGDEEALRIELEHDRNERLPVQARLEVELDHPGGRFLGGAQHVVVRHQQ